MVFNVGNAAISATEGEPVMTSLEDIASVAKGHLIPANVDQKRLQDDIKKLCELPKNLFSVSLPESRDEACFLLEILTAGQIDLTIRKNVKFRVTIPAGYPKSPPSAKCLNVSDVKSEHISAAGTVLINLLEDDHGGWSSYYDLCCVAYALRRLFVGTGFKYSVINTVSGDSTGSFSLRAGVAHLKGRRASMEDRDISMPDLHDILKEVAKTGTGSSPMMLSPGAALYAVMDGHGGEEASEFCSKELPKMLVAELLQKTATAKTASMREALWNACATTDEHFLSQPPMKRGCSGSTVVAALFDGVRSVTIANVGDSRCVLCRKGRAVGLSIDHKPTRPDETARIVDAGGFVFMKRVMGQLAVSRAIGDTNFKKDSCKVVVPEPDFYEVTLCCDDQFILLACDGLFDVMDNQAAVDYVLKCLNGNKGDAAAAAKQLVELAVHKLNSSDNVTASIVLISGGNPSAPPKQPSPKSLQKSGTARAKFNPPPPAAAAAASPKGAKGHIDADMMSFLMDDNNF